MRSVGGEIWRNGAATVGALVVVGGLFGPWVRSGASTRTSFELFDLAERLGFTSDGWFAWAVRPWPLVPLLVVGAVCAGWAGRSRVAAALGTTASVYVLAVAVAVLAAPDPGVIESSWGIHVAIIGALALLAASWWHAATLWFGARRASTGSPGSG